MAGSRRHGLRRIALIAGAMLAIIALVGGRRRRRGRGRGPRAPDRPSCTTTSRTRRSPARSRLRVRRSRTATRSARRPDDQRRERQRQLRGHGTPQRDLDRGQPGATPSNMISGANDYQLGDQPGRPRDASTRSRATGHVRRRPQTGPRTRSARRRPTRPRATRPSTSTMPGNAYYATLGFRFVGPANAQNPDILVSVSKDGGVTWDAHAWRRAAATRRPSATCSTRST